MFEDLHIETNSGYYIVCLGLQTGRERDGGREEGSRVEERGRGEREG